jgi:Holliday junction resolvase RusA-like endonuclease
MVGTWQLEVPGPVRGFIVHARPWSKAAKDYCAWKVAVRLHANVAGVPEEIPAGYRAHIHLDVTWRLRARIDLSNVLKGVEDSLFKRDRGIVEIHAVSRQYVGEEKATVTVRLERETDGCRDSGRSRSRRKGDSQQQPLDDAGRG